MKINTKIAIAVISIVLPALFVTVYISSGAFNKVYAEEQQEDYIKTRQLVDNVVRLQGEKLSHLARSIGNDATFLHSSLLASELGYTERPAGILSQYMADTDVSVYLYVDSATGRTISNALSGVAPASIDAACASGRMTMFEQGGHYILLCSDVRYEGQMIGRLLLGYQLAQYEKILSDSLAKHVLITLDTADADTAGDRSAAYLLSQGEGIKRYEGSEYYVYDLGELYPGAAGLISVRQGRISSIYARYRPYVMALFQYIAVFAAVIAALHGVTWLLVARRLNRIHRMIGHEVEKKSIDLDGLNLRGDEIAETRDTLAELFKKLDHYERDKEREAHLTAIGKTSAMIAHDIRSPLAVLKTYFDHDERDDPDCQCRDAAKRSVSKLLRMADDLVDIARASTVDRDVRNLRTVVCRDVMPEVKKKAAEADVIVRCNADKDIYADIDSDKIERVIVNIVNNSIDACEGRGGEVVVSLNNVGRNLVIEITDDGRGISEENLAYIFDSFFTREKKKGTGLGLSYCKQVVDAHGGTIEVRSKVGVGTTFTIRIPDCVLEAKESRAKKNDPEISCENRRFIIVDDDADIRMRWRRIVESAGGTVAHEASSLEDIEARGEGIDYRDIDVAMVDYHYEGSRHTGADVIRHMRAKGVGEVHLCTGFYDDDHVRTEAFSAGADSVMPKG